MKFDAKRRYLGIHHRLPRTVGLEGADGDAEMEVENELGIGELGCEKGNRLCADVDGSIKWTKTER